MLRRLRIFLFVATVLLVVAISALVVAARIYEPEAKQALVQVINERLDAPVSVRDMDLTLIARFPMAGLRLHDVLAMELRSDGQEADTLLYARELYLEFSIWGLLRGDYTIERIHGDKVDLRPGLDANGMENYLVLKQDSSATSGSTIALEKVSFNDLSLRYRDGRSRIDIRSHSRSLSLAGHFGGTLSTLTLEGDLALHHWDQGDERILADRQGHLRLDLSFGGEDGAFRITKGEVNTGEVPIELSLELLPTAGGRVLDLRANGFGIPLGQAFALLPERITRSITGYDLRGTADIALRYAGPLDTPGPSLSVGAKVTKGRVKELRSGTVFSDIAGEMALDLDPKGTPSRVLVKGFSARSGNGSLSGNWESTGLVNAPLKADLHVDIGLAELMRFAKVDTLEQVSGRLKADAVVEGRLRDVAGFRASDLKALRISGGATLRNATLKLKGVRHRVEALDADLALNGNDASIQGLKAVVQGSTLQLRGTLRNLIPYLLFDEQRLAIEAEATSPRIDLGALLRSEGSSRSSEGDYTVTLPATIELDLRARVDELVFEDFVATAISGTLRMKDQVLRVDPVTLNTANGAVLGQLTLDARGPAGSDHRLAIDANIQGIDVTELFREFKDFGQEFIGHRHLSGITQARVELRAPLSPSMSIDMQRLTCTIDIAIDNGGIKGHKPLMEVAEYLRKNRLVAPFVNTDALRDRLADVRFARLENRIDIRDGAVHIPTMEVRSTALDLELSGTHWFDDRIEHHLNFRLGELFRLGKPARDEFGPIIDDGTGMRIFLRMYGTANDPQFANDGAMAANRRRQQFQQEKQELRSILREDLGLFRKKQDPAPRTDTPGTTRETPAPRFDVEWAGGDSSTAKAGAPEPKPRRGLGRLLDKDKPQEEQVRFKVED
jgi:hypothetical protein